MVFILKWQNSQPVIVCLNMHFSRNLRDYWYMRGGGGGGGGCGGKKAAGGGGGGGGGGYVGQIESAELWNVRNLTKSPLFLPNY